MSIPSRQLVAIGDIRFGDSEIILMAGPCAIENEAQIMACAEAVAGAGIGVLRGGAYKPRTSRQSFPGMGFDGYRLLRQAAERFGLLTISEVLSVSQVHEAEGLVDILQVGSRSMQHYPLLQAIGKSGKPVLLKRGFGNSIDEWLQAAEYIAAEGNTQILMCERGIRSFEGATRFTLDISAVPLLKASCPYPVIVDPSHAAGRRDIVPALCRAAIAAGADGLLVEAHPSPESAFSDGAQSLDLGDLSSLVAELERVALSVGRRLATSRKSE